MSRAVGWLRVRGTEERATGVRAVVAWGVEAFGTAVRVDEPEDFVVLRGVRF